MIALGLIGSNITHSKSPQIYRTLLSVPHRYDLLDYSSPEEVPRLTSLNQYFGLNVTAPFKTTFLDQLSDYPKKWGAINCLKNTPNGWIGENTDAKALEELVPVMKKMYGVASWVILGDGAMASVTKTILAELGMKYSQFSRKMGDDFDQFSFFKNIPNDTNCCVINCCSRDLSIRGSMSKNWIFWDYNYLHKEHAQTISSKVRAYVDGESLLITQANHAVKFWGLS